MFFHLPYYFVWKQKHFRYFQVNGEQCSVSWYKKNSVRRVFFVETDPCWVQALWKDSSPPAGWGLQRVWASWPSRVWHSQYGFSPGRVFVRGCVCVCVCACVLHWECTAEHRKLLTHTYTWFYLLNLPDLLVRVSASIFRIYLILPEISAKADKTN